VQQLREWNSLAADEVKIGQTLFVSTADVPEAGRNKNPARSGGG
jgi:hypothetical protein